MIKLAILSLVFVCGGLYSADAPIATFTAKELTCLAQNIHFEARGEQKLGKIAVAHVTINRTKSRRFPSGICSVVMQPGQFSWIKQIPNFNKVRIPEATFQIALDVLTNKYKDPTRGALFFHNADVEAFNRTVSASIGNHVFYR